MKTTCSVLLALGLVSQTALAQMQAPQPAPAAGPAVAADVTGPTSAPSPSSSGSTSDLSSGSSNGMQSEAGAEYRQDLSPIGRLKPVTQDDVTYLCGGVGEEEEVFMKQEAKGYDLMLTFAARDGSYLADVDVDIKDAKGNTVLQAACDSPILLVDLPRGGTYRVRAEAAGYELNRTVKVAASAKKTKHTASAVLSWPQQAAEAGAPPAATGSSGAGAGAGQSAGPESGSQGAR